MKTIRIATIADELLNQLGRITCLDCEGHGKFVTGDSEEGFGTRPCCDNGFADVQVNGVLDGEFIIRK